jgi:hypothetical protein
MLILSDSLAAEGEPVRAFRHIAHWAEAVEIEIKRIAIAPAAIRRNLIVRLNFLKGCPQSSRSA